MYSLVLARGLFLKRFPSLILTQRCSIPHPTWGSIQSKTALLFISQFSESSTRKRIKKKEVMEFDHGRKYLYGDTTAHKCNQCEYTSSKADTLRGHLKKHSGEKANKCNQCDYVSSQVGNLRRHSKTHSGKKSNKCNQCDFASSYASALGTHLITHSGEKANKCNQCDYASSHAGHLRTHLKRHSGERPYKCNQCDYVIMHPLMYSV